MSSPAPIGGPSGPDPGPTGGATATPRPRLAGDVSAALVFLAVAVLYLKPLATASLVLDEAWLANYLVGVTRQPWFWRPLLFVGLERATVWLLGPGEAALRLWPCLAGLAAVGLTYVWARREIGRARALLAAGLVAVAPEFSWHAHLVKNYTFDALFAVVLLLAHARWERRRDARSLLLYGLWAALSLGFSFTTPFLIAALALVEVARRGRPRPERWRFLAVSLAVGAVFLPLYLAVYAEPTFRPLLQAYWESFFPSPDGLLALPAWTARRTGGLLAALSGLGSGLAALALAGAGGVWAAWRLRRAWPVALVLALALNLGAAVLHRYPYGAPRLSLGLAPLVCALVASGIGLLLPPRRGGVLRLMPLAALLYVVLYPALATLPAVWRAGVPDRALQEESRDLVARLAIERRPGDAVWVAEGAGAAFRYYWFRTTGKPPGAEADGVPVIWAKGGRERPEIHAPEVAEALDRFRRVWVLFAHDPREKGEVLRRLFAERGKSRLRDERVNAWLELFERAP